MISSEDVKSFVQKSAAVWNSPNYGEGGFSDRNTINEPTAKPVPKRMNFEAPKAPAAKPKNYVNDALRSAGEWMAKPQEHRTQSGTAGVSMAGKGAAKDLSGNVYTTNEGVKTSGPAQVARPADSQAVANSQRIEQLGDTWSPVQRSKRDGMNFVEKRIAEGQAKRTFEQEQLKNQNKVEMYGRQKNPNYAADAETQTKKMFSTGNAKKDQELADSYAGKLHQQNLVQSRGAVSKDIAGVGLSGDPTLTVAGKLDELEAKNKRLGNIQQAVRPSVQKYAPVVDETSMTKIAPEKSVDGKISPAVRRYDVQGNPYVVANEDIGTGETTYAPKSVAGENMERKPQLFNLLRYGEGNPNLINRAFRGKINADDVAMMNKRISPNNAGDRLVGVGY